MEWKHHKNVQYKTPTIYPAGSPEVQPSNRMKDKATHPVIQSSVPDREFDDLGRVSVVAVFPDGRRMATSSSDNMLRLWDLKNGTMIMELEGRGSDMRDMALSRDGRLIVSSDCQGYVIAWHGDTGRPLTQAFNAHSDICWLDFSPDSVYEVHTGAR